MSKKFKLLVYSLSSNIISFLASFLVTFIVPRFFGVEEYGYFQLFIFYVGYVGFAHLGWLDGIILRYGGKYYDELNKTEVKAQLVLCSLLELSICIVICLVSMICNVDSDKKFIFFFVSICVLISNLNTFFQYILQSTGKIKQYALIVILDRVTYLVLCCFFLLLGFFDFRYLIVSYVAGVVIAITIGIYACKEIVLSKLKITKESFVEAWDNLSSGFKLMVANICSSLTIGIVRFFIEYKWGVAVFGKVSLSLSVANAVLLLINAISIVLYPLLRRTESSKYRGIYQDFRTIFILLILIAMIAYYPGQLILNYWLPKYSDSIRYLAILFPVCLYEGKNSLLSTTFIKVLRYEKKLMKFNIISLFLSVVLSSIAVFVLQNVNYAVLSILIVLAVKSNMAEIFITEKLDISIVKDIILESLIVCMFVCLFFFHSSFVSMMLMALIAFFYAIYKRKDMLNSLKCFIELK